MKYRCQLFSSDEENDMALFEDLMTKSYQQDGSISVIQKETKLTEEGKYLIALHWVEDSSSSDESRRVIDSIIDEGV